MTRLPLDLNLLVAFVTGTDLPTVLIERPAVDVIEGTAEEIPA